VPIVNIGRAEYNDLVIPDDSVSSQHAKLTRREGVWMLTDVGSTNGTMVDGERITSDTPIAPGAFVRFGMGPQAASNGAQLTGIVADSGEQVSQCTGSKTRTGEQWADTFYGVVGSTGQTWEIGFVVNNFRGPGTYHTTDSTIVVRSLDKKKVWLNLSRDKVTFSVSSTQQSGTVDAALTDATTGKPGLKVIGQWNCRG